MLTLYLVCLVLSAGTCKAARVKHVGKLEEGGGGSNDVYFRYKFEYVTRGHLENITKVVMQYRPEELSSSQPTPLKVGAALSEFAFFDKTGTKIDVYDVSNPAGKRYPPEYFDLPAQKEEASEGWAALSAAEQKEKIAKAYTLLFGEDRKGRQSSKDARMRATLAGYSDGQVENLMDGDASTRWTDQTSSPLYFELRSAASSFTFTTVKEAEMPISCPDCNTVYVNSSYLDPVVFKLSVERSLEKTNVWEGLFDQADKRAIPLGRAATSGRHLLTSHSSAHDSGVVGHHEDDVQGDYNMSDCSWEHKKFAKRAFDEKLGKTWSGSAWSGSAWSGRCAEALEDMVESRLNHPSLGITPSVEEERTSLETLLDSTHNAIGSRNVPSYIFSQIALNKRQCQKCMSFCAVCDADENDQHKTIYVTRSKSRLDAAKSIALAPADAIAATLEASGKGAVRVGQQGAVDTVGAFGSAGAAVGHVLVDGSDSGGSTGRIGGGAIVGFFAGVLVGVPFAPVGAVAGGLVGAVSGLMHSYTCPSGGWKVSGWTEDHIKCGRLGFVEAQGGKVTNTEFSSKLFRDSGFKKLQMEKTNDPKDIVAEHHCKNMTSFNFDVRHMAECLKHTKLCGHKGGYVAPRTGKDVCVKASGKKKQDLVNDMIGAMFTDTDLE